MISLRRFLWSNALVLSLIALPGAARGDSRWVQVGPGGGVVLALAAEPSDPRVVYAATPESLFRSLDGGATWTLRSASGSASPHFAPGVLAVDPRSSGHLFTAGLATGRDFTPNGIFESFDAGATWSDVSAGLPRQGNNPVFIYQLVFNPRNPAELFAATFRGLFVRRSGEAAWQPFALAGDEVTVIAFDPTDPKALLAFIYTSEERRGLFRSTDGGQTWTLASRGFMYSALVFDPSQPSRVYGAGGGFFRSLDGGQTWTELTSMIPRALAVDHDGTLYAAPLNGVFRSEDAGETWSPVPDFDQYHNRPYDGVSALLLQPGDPGSLLAGGSRGLWRSTDRAKSWRASSTGFTAHSPQSLTAADGQVYFSDLGVFKSADSGRTWKLAGQGLAGLVSYTQVVPVTPVLGAAPSDPQVVYAHGGSASDRFARSDDGGEHWHLLPGAAPGGEKVSQVVVDPVSPLTVYVTGEAQSSRDVNCQTLKSTDGGASWTCLKIEALQLVVHPKQPRIVMAAGTPVLRSENGGKSWTEVARNLPQNAYATSVALDPVDPQVVWIGTYRGVFRSGNGGVTVQRMSQGLPAGRVTSLLVDPRNTAVVYAILLAFDPDHLAGQGVYRSTDGGRHWSRFVSGLPTEQLTGEMALDSREGLLYAATSSLGLWRISLDPQ